MAFIMTKLSYENRALVAILLLCLLGSGLPAADLSDRVRDASSGEGPALGRGCPGRHGPRRVD